MNETAKEETTASTSNTSEESETRPEKTGNESDEAMAELAQMKAMPLRDVPSRLAALALAVDFLNLRLAHVTGMAMGAGYLELHKELESVGLDYVAVEHELTGWRLALHNDLKEIPGEF